MQPCQSLFVAPCSHTWHYKCIRVIINGPHWPHFICPNCRTVADLEAELDDPYSNGEWEEVQATDVAPASEQNPVEKTTSNEAVNSEGQGNEGSESRAVPTPMADNGDSGHNNRGSSDLEIVDSNDDSGHEHLVDEAADDFGYMNIEESPSPLDSDDSHLGSVPTGATVPPMDIISRKPVANSSSASSRLDQPTSRLERAMTRTPSPNSHNSLVIDSSTGAEGPMTPRNDAGPFIFDGSGGRPSDLNPHMAPIAITNLNAAADTPPVHIQ